MNEKLDKRPDPVIFAQLQARYEGMQLITEEKEKRIETLTNGAYPKTQDSVLDF